MIELRHAAIFALALLFGLTAQADDEPVSLDSVDTGETRSLDSVDTGSTRSLDSVDTGETVDQDTLDVGHTTSLDDADKGRSVDADTLATETTESLDEAEAEAASEAPPSLPGPLPSIADDSLRADAQAAREELVAAERRAEAANAAYSEMRARDYPRGDAAAAIAREYAAANVAYEQANARYREILEQVDPASLDD